MDDDVRPVEVSAPQSGPIMGPTVAIPRNRHVDDVGSKPSEAMPPRGRQAARHGVLAIAPHGRPDTCGVTKWSVVGKVDATCAPAPMTRAHTSLDSFKTDPGAARLSKRDDAVLPPQILVEHARWTSATLASFPTAVISARLRSLGDP
jgi:hypothetical protein